MVVARKVFYFSDEYNAFSEYKAILVLDTRGGTPVRNVCVCVCLCLLCVQATASAKCNTKIIIIRTQENNDNDADREYRE